MRSGTDVRSGSLIVTVPFALEARVAERGISCGREGPRQTEDVEYFGHQEVVDRDDGAVAGTHPVNGLEPQGAPLLSVEGERRPRVCTRGYQPHGLHASPRD